MIVPLGREHADRVAALHCAALTGLLAELGEPAARAFYAGAVESGAAVGFVSLGDGAVDGFVFGSVHPDRLKGSAARCSPAGLAAGVLLGVLKRPGSLVRLLKSFRGPDEGTFDADAPELTYLAVSAGRRGGGIGRGLVDAFSQAMRGAGAAAYELSVDDDNQRAAAFYEKRGFERVGSYREFGTARRRYRLKL
ncbi:MAG TPA: GNAT family N-acetyltransferase [Elusimicrobiota bacterium]|nr:GNAT family N-acetyltransferase [Elusimicrobiota bacterium]